MKEIMMVRRASLWLVAVTMVFTLLTAGRPALAAPPPFAALPLPAQAAISAALGRDDHAYHAAQSGQGLRLQNPRHHLTADLTPAGLTLHTGPHTWGLHYQSAGYGAARVSASTALPTAQANRVEYRRGPLTEWYINGPQGLEHGFTLTESPSPRTASRLTLRFALSGTLRARLDPDGSGLTLTQPDGRPRLAYRGLTAFDATGRALPARLALQGGSLTIEIEDANARYPLTIDPVVQEVKLTASDGSVGNLLGYSVAISGDTVVVGAPHANPSGYTNQGAAYVFIKSGASWESTTEAAKLTASDGAADDRFGVRVAISASGDTIVVGAFDQRNSRGAAYVFVKPGGWTGGLHESAKLLAGNSAANDAFGLGVAISASGDTIVVGAPTHPYNPKDEPGAAYVFNKPGGGWTGLLTENTKLTASDGAANDFFGFGVAISASGDTIVVGAFGAGAGQGAAYVFTGADGAWIQQAILAASDGAQFNELGVAVAMNGVGDTIVAGAWRANVGSQAYQGAAYVYAKPTTGWTDSIESAKLTASDGAANDYLGFAVALSGDTIVVGTYNGGVGQGAAYVFNKPVSGWTGPLTENTKLTDGTAGNALGIAAAVQGRTAIVGTMNAAEAGAAYVFILSQVDSTLTLTVSKAGAGTGTVTSSPAGISCGATCSAPFTSGTTVTLTATPDAGSTFSGWSGNCSGSSSPTTVTMTVDKSCTATFALAPSSYALTVSKAGTGTGTVTSSPAGISCGSSCSAPFTSGTTVTLTATPDTGSTFTGWSGACTGTGTCTVTMTAAQSVTATFALAPSSYALTVSKAGTGTGTVTSSPAGISCGSSCSAPFTSGTTVTLTATPDAGSTFSGWSGNCSGSSSPTTVTMTAAKSCTATFAATPTPSFAKTYGGANDDWIGSIRQTTDGGYIVAGYTTSFGAGNADAWVLKLDATGAVQWQKTYGGVGYDEATSIQQTTDGGYIVAGYTNSFGAGYQDAWVLKLDSTGTVVWQQTYGGTDYDYATSIQQTTDGGYIVAGRTRSFGGAGFDDAWILKLNSTGTVEWQKTYGGTGGDEATSIQQTTDGGYIVAGSTSFGAGNADAWVLKLDAVGAVQWQRTYGGAANDYATSIHQTADGGYIVSGT
ncbi:MAG: hypothetical protein KGJ40_05895, partial [candidate division NC10 bacterium]|nr:hypothetical protein [candidate division NC10 bacterium]